MKQELTNKLKFEPLRIMIDTSSDAGLQKTFPVTLCLFHIKVVFVDMNMPVGRNVSTVQFRFHSIDTLFNTFELHWNIVKCFGLDNSNSETGCRKSIK